MKRVFFVDFDGTITLQDTCDAMTKAFAGEGWQESLHRWEKGELTTQGCAREIFRLFNVTKEELASFLATIPIDETFRDFVGYVENRGEKLFIVSDGYDFNLSIILGKAGLSHLPRFSNRLVIRDNQYDIDSPFQLTECDKCGTCKKELVSRLKEDTEEVVYIGDGYSDMCGCQAADLIFAKGSLLNYCQKENLPVIPFSSFADILRWLKEHDER
ncbi:MAG: 2,3-diketo-5-methylthio-phosphopentanephosphat [Peptococcaceae bacterium]|jgi:2,3-diketo-5-methylthio-1-phosphopentane phosphatase|nr:2,3-diketo-5-methylthio-phosphopentanephosphat [Peptococcaceae bacterium]